MSEGPGTSNTLGARRMKPEEPSCDAFAHIVGKEPDPALEGLSMREHSAPPPAKVRYSPYIRESQIPTAKKAMIQRCMREGRLPTDTEIILTDRERRQLADFAQSYAISPGIGSSLTNRSLSGLLGETIMSSAMSVIGIGLLNEMVSYVIGGNSSVFKSIGETAAFGALGMFAAVVSLSGVFGLNLVRKNIAARSAINKVYKAADLAFKSPMTDEALQYMEVK